MLEQSLSTKSLPVLCFSHLRWNFVYQRPQHLLSRCQRASDVHFWEEPLYESGGSAELRREITQSGVRVLTPIFPEGIDQLSAAAMQREMVDEYLEEQGINRFVAWYYTPMALEFSRHLEPVVTVYDCMDELSAFQGAAPELIGMEQRLFGRADVVFAGGASLFEAKRRQHANVHLFPSSIDLKHFSRARLALEDPEDQAHIPHPRIGFFGVLDERLDGELLAAVAARNAAWQFVLIGPVAKISPDQLPKAANIHYLGQKAYEALPSYLANWDMAMLPFAQNASTRFISPTKTPEYLAAGKPVVSTPIRDVVRPYGELGLVEIAGDAESFAAAIKKALGREDEEWLASVDRHLSGMSWDKTFEGMWREIQKSMRNEHAKSAILNSTERSGSYV